MREGENQRERREGGKEKSHGEERRRQKAVYAVYRMYRDFIIPHTANLDNWTGLDCSVVEMKVEVEEAEQNRAW